MLPFVVRLIKKPCSSRLKDYLIVCIHYEVVFFLYGEKEVYRRRDVSHVNFM